MNCQNCSADLHSTTHPDSSSCQQCEPYELPPSLADRLDGIIPTGRATDFRCPVCDEKKLAVGLIGDSQVCFCETCGGFVIDSQSLGYLIKQLRVDYCGMDDNPILLDPKELDSVRSCPACNTRMDTHPYYGPGNVILDSCMHCKLTWLDHSELAKIKKAPGLR